MKSITNNNTLLIWDVKAKVPSGYDHKVLWQDFANQSDSETSVPSLVEEDAEFLRSEYLSLIHELGELKVGGIKVVDYLLIKNKYSYWWMTLLVEKCNYSKSPQIDNVIKLMAFQKWLSNRQISNIFLVSENSDLIDSMELLARKESISFNFEKRTSHRKEIGIIKRIYFGLPNRVKTLVWLISYIFSRWPLKGEGVYFWKKSKAVYTFMSYFINFDKHDLQQGNFNSAYWPELPKILESKKIQTNWLHIFVKSETMPSPRKAKKVLNKLNQSNKDLQKHTILESFLSYDVVRAALNKYYKLTRIKNDLSNCFKAHSDYLWPLLKSDFDESFTGVVALNNLLNFELLDKAFSLLPTQKKGFYLQENQAWELGLIMSWRNNRHNNELVGIPHSTVCFWDLRYFYDPRSYSNQSALPMPDFVGVNGLAARNSYIKGNYPKEQLVDLEALRYLYLGKVLQKNVNFQNSQKKYQLLILGDSLPENTKNQMSLIEKAAKDVKVNISYLAKPHPACPIFNEDYPNLKFEVSNDPLSLLIIDCDLVYTSNRTSAAVDAYYSKKPVITIIDPKKLNFSPLREYENISFVYKSEQIVSILNNIEKLKIDCDKSSENYFYLDSKLPKWKSLLNA